MATVSHQNHAIELTGQVGFANVDDCLGDILNIFQGHHAQHYQVNLAQVEHLDGSIIALLISLLRHAKSLGIKVDYLNVPDHILRVSELYGVRNILPLTAQ